MKIYKHVDLYVEMTYKGKPINFCLLGAEDKCEFSTDEEFNLTEEDEKELTKLVLEKYEIDRSIGVIYEIAT